MTESTTASATSTSAAMRRVTGAAPATVSAAAVFWALLRRDVRVARRELPYFLLRTLMQPVLFIIVFGYLMPKMNYVGRGYTTALLPGVLAVSLTLSAIQSVALPLVADFGWTKEIEDRLLAPVPTYLIAMEKIVAGVLQGLISALVVLPVARVIMGPVEGLTFVNAGELVVVTLLGAATFSSLGLLMGTAINPQQIGLMFSIIVAPMIFFGCAYYPWRGLEAVPVMKYLVLADPLTYVAEGMRGALTPSVPHMSFAAVLGALAALCAAFLFLGVRAFERRAVG
ncbi:MAG TPA: ABC transporter permease [Gemmatimonadaceae bacterium]|nr:ABC transporter permease [Gemmatimonadaceae bacterium]